MEKLNWIAILLSMYECCSGVNINTILVMKMPIDQSCYAFLSFSLNVTYLMYN